MPASTTGTNDAGNDHGRRATNHARTVGFIHAVGFVVGRGPCGTSFDRLLFNVFLVRFLVEDPLFLTGISYLYLVSLFLSFVSTLVAQRDACVGGAENLGR